VCVREILEGSYSKYDVEKDISKRIENGVGDIGIVLFYKESFPQNLADSKFEEKLKNSTFEVRLIVPEDVTGTLVAYLKGRQREPR
jgi:hypothetical protein